MTTIAQVRDLLKKVGGAPAPGTNFAVWTSRNIQHCVLDKWTAPQVLGPSDDVFEVSGDSEDSEDVVENQKKVEEKAKETKKLENQKKVEKKPKEACLFCSAPSHVSIECDAFWNSKMRRMQVSAKKLCLKCLQPKDSESHATCPFENVECDLCSTSSRKYFHHSILCNAHVVKKK